MSDLQERLKTFIDSKNISIRQFERSINVANGYIGGLKKSTSADKIEKIIQIYPELNRDWLVNGTGEMLNPIKTIKKTIGGGEVIPLYGIASTCGMGADRDTADEIENYLNIPIMPKVDGAVRAVGDSMHPIIKPGDVVFYKLLNNPDSVVFGLIYLVHLNIDGDNQLLIKYVKKSDKGDDYLKLVSHNCEHDPQDFHKKDILNIALIKAHLTFNAV